VSDGTYNGWPSKASWSLFTHLTGNKWHEAGALGAMRGSTDPAETLKGYVRDALLKPILDRGGLEAQLIGDALATVDWAHLAAGLREGRTDP
jgi:hypothetical protein